MVTKLRDPLTLPSGFTLPNRVAKAAMSEHLASKRQAPTRGLQALYGRWAEGGAGLIITGNVMIDRRHMEANANVVLADAPDLERFRAWAEAGTRGGTPLFMQLNHPGRQTPRHINPTPLAPSAVPPVNLFRRASAFGHPRAMSERDIEDVIAAFARAAGVAKQTGFSGVQVHGAHGYLVSQFLSPLTNQRTDGWGGSLENRARFGRAVLRAIRSEVGSAFPVAVKLNSADFQRGGFSEDESLQVLHWLQADGLDLVEISGGSYESRVMLDKPLSDREAFFLDYARKARAAVDIPLMVTGGFRSRAIMEQALAQGALDVVGLARPFTHNPDVARDLCTGRIVRAEDPPPMPGLARLGGTSEAMMSVAQMALLSKGKDPARGMSLRAVLGALVQEGVSLVRGKG
ncbi:MAG: NADH:flavin oxidoreductase/NADH oxidase family protein [Polyangiales bacterium]